MLALLANACDKDRLIFVAEEARRSNPANIPFTEYLYVLVTFADQFLMDAKMTGVLGQSLFALARGAGSLYKMHAHIDESGYTRNTFLSADYPRPRGWASRGVNTQLIRMFRYIHPLHHAQVRADVLRLLLESANLLHDADPLAVKGEASDAFVTVLEREEPKQMKDISKPAAWPELVAVTSTWYRHAALFPWCIIIVCNEAHTSKMCGQCGSLHNKLGSSRTFLCPSYGYNVD